MYRDTGAQVSENENKIVWNFFACWKNEKKGTQIHSMISFWNPEVSTDVPNTEPFNKFKFSILTDTNWR